MINKFINKKVDIRLLKNINKAPDRTMIRKCFHDDISSLFLEFVYFKKDD